MWTKLSPDGAPPAAREGSSAIYDVANDRMIVFGGENPNGTLNDVWALDLTPGIELWHQFTLSETLPSARTEHSAIYDAAHERMIVFGGRDSNNSSAMADVWVLDLATVGAETWTQFNLIGPVRRSKHSAIYDTLRDRMIMFGGIDYSSEVLNDVWALNLTPGGQAWLKLDSPGPTIPPDGSGNNAVYDTIRDRMIVFGGGYSSLWALDLQTTPGQWTKLSQAKTPPLIGQENNVVYDAARDRALVFTSGFNDLWVLEWQAALGFYTWQRLELAEKIPPRCTSRSAIYDAAHERLIVYGGHEWVGHTCSDVWALDLGTPGAKSWTQLNPNGTPPPSREKHSAIYDSFHGRMIVFGGDSMTHYLNDVWALDLTPGAETWVQLNPSGELPETRIGHSAVYDANSDHMIVFGGHHFSYEGGYHSTFLNDVWTLNLTNLGAESWTKLSPDGTFPPSRMEHSAVYDAAQNRMIVFGGENSDDAYNDVWTLDLGTSGQVWTEISPSGLPPSLTYDTFNYAYDTYNSAYDAAHDRMIVFGGCKVNSCFNDLWVLDLSTPGDEHWSYPSTQDHFINQPISSLAVPSSFSADHTLLLASQDTLYRSSDAGQTWAASATLPGLSDLLFSPSYASDRTLYALAHGDVHQSNDDGLTWSALSENLNAHSLSLASEGPKHTLLAATANGVWRYTFPSLATVRSLILTHQGRLSERYGSQAASALLARLYDLAEHPQVQGLVLDLSDAEAYPQLAAAYAAWDASAPSDNTASANLVAQSIRDIILDHTRVFSNTQYLVLVGHDEIIPFHRLPDLTADHSLPYSAYAPISGTIALALADNTTLSDDPYAAQSPIIIPSLSRKPNPQSPLYIPDLSIGRLVESPADILASIDAFLSHDQVNQHSLALVSGADNYLLDSAHAISYTLRSANLALASLLGNHWSASDLAPLLLERENDLVSLNQHAYHDKLLAPDQTYLGPQDVLDASADLQGTLVAAQGCHAGLSLPDAPNGPLGLDFPQAFAQRGAPFVGNTGYGWATLYSVGLSERLLLYLHQQLAPLSSHSVTIGQALRKAKRRYYLSSWRFDEYDATVLNELTLYGLPMYSFSTPIKQVASREWQVADETLPADITITYATSNTQYPISNIPPFLTQASIQFQFPAENFNVSDVGQARYYSYLGEVQASRGLPLLPRFSFGVSLPGAQTQGVLFAGGVYSDVLAAPVTSTAIISDGDDLDLSSGYTPRQWYPTVLELVNQLAQGGDDRLALSLGQVHKVIDPSGGAITPTQRLYDQVSFEVYYYNQLPGGVPDRTPPQVLDVYVWQEGENQARVNVLADDVLGAGDSAALGLWRVVVAYTANTPGLGHWDSVELTYQPGSGLWSGVLPLASHPSPLLLVQAIDQAGNVRADDDDGWYYTPTTTPGVIIAGPATGSIAQPHTFTATVSAPDTTLPLTYTWQASGQPALLTSTHALSHSVSYTWNTPGPQAITLSVASAERAFSDTHLILIDAPPPDLTISGPTVGQVQTPLTFSANLNALAGSLAPPFTFTWQATDQPQATRVVSAASDNITLSWTTPGTKLINVSVTHAGGAASGTHTIELTLPQLYLPLVLK